MGGSKAAITSSGVIGALVAGAALLAPLVGYTISDDAAQTMNHILNDGFLLITNGIAIVGAGVALYGRITATKQITGVITAK